jgi:hypothetical protein
VWEGEENFLNEISVVPPVAQDEELHWLQLENIINRKTPTAVARKAQQFPEYQRT